MLLSCSLYLLKSLKLAIVILSNSMVILFLFWYPRFYWIMSLNATVVFLGLSYIQHSAAWPLVLLTPFMSTLMALITLHMMHYNLIYQPEKCKQITLYIDFFWFLWFFQHIFLSDSLQLLFQLREFVESVSYYT